MKLVVYSTLLSILIIGCYGAAHPRSRRNVGQFGVMIGCLLDIPVSRAGADYVGYGCFCGFGGDGSPVDDTDRCCQVHDDCYTAVQYSDMCRGYNQAYLIVYNYETTDCGTGDAKLACSDASSYDPSYRYTDCAIAMCACDKAGAECFTDKRPTYNADYLRYPQNKCV